MLLEALALSQITNPKLPPQPPEPTRIVEILNQEPKTIKHKVERGDTLVKIAKKYDTKWQRIFYKNKSIKNPDLLEVEQTLVIPSKGEKLKKREYTQPVPKDATQQARMGDTASSGWYPAGECTAYVASRRSVGQWNNASDWLWQARRDGYTISQIPKAGAIAWKYGHVAFVESVQSNSMTISEANYDYNGSIRTITIPISSYTAFIY